jgi:septal ring factor EnvC (AmiA/AmiB activator)
LGNFGHMRLFANYIFIALIVFAVHIPAFAAKPLSIEETRAAMKEKQKQQKELKKKSDALVEEVTDLKKDLIKTTQEIQTNEKNLSIADENLSNLYKEKSEVSENIDKTIQKSGGLIRSAYVYSSTPLTQIALKSDPISAARAAIVIKSVLPTLNARSNLLKTQMAALSDLEANIYKKKKQAEEKAIEIKQKKSALDKLLEDRKTQYQKTEQARKKQEKELAALASQAKNLEDLMRRIENKEKRERANKADTKAAKITLPPGMQPPVSGIVKTAFGQNDELGASSDGITFSVRPGSVISSPLAGQVKFAGPFQKFGRVLIVQHAGGYHSLIAGLGRIDTVVGANLDAGEPVGAAPEEKLPDQRQNIYFELRHQGQPVNPQKALIAEQKGGKNRT